MSIKLMSAIFESKMSDLSYMKEGTPHNAKASTAKLVLLALADRASNTGESCFPSYERMILNTALSAQGLADTYDALEQNGYISIARKGSRMGTNDYTINIRMFPDMADYWSDLPKEEKPFVKPLEKDLSSHLGKIVKPLEYNHHITIKEPSLRENDFLPLEQDQELKEKEDLAAPLEWRILSGQKVTQKDLDASRPAQIPGSEFFTQYHPDQLRYAEPFAQKFERGPRNKGDAKIWRDWIDTAIAYKLTPEDLVDQITINWQAGLTVKGPMSVVDSAYSRKQQEKQGVQVKPRFEKKEAYVPPATAVFADDDQ